MAKTSLIIESTNTSGKKIQKTFTDVNPEATSAELKTFAQMCNGLTSNTYVRTDRIDKINCDTEAITTKTAPTLAFTSPTVTVSEISTNVTTSNAFSYIFTYNGDATIDQFYITGDLASMNLMTIIQGGNGTFTLVFKRNTSGSISPGVITLHVPETDTYAAASATFTITA